MRHGQIGTDAEGRVIFIWEGAVASIPNHYTIQTLERYKRRLHLYDQAVGYWEVHPWCLALMWSLMQRTPWRIDVCVTSRDAGFTKALSAKATRENWPVRYVFAETPQGLGRLLPQMPDVTRIYYGLEEQRFNYGPQGYHLDPSKPITVS